MRRMVIINGCFPSLNDYIDANRTGKGRWNKGNAMKQRDQDRIIWELRRQLKGVRIVAPVFLRYKYFEKNRRRDLDNISGYFHKVFQDALVESHILPNDNWHYIVGFSDDFHVDGKAPRIEVEIIEG